jgi:hypothetical protein
MSNEIERTAEANVVVAANVDVAARSGNIEN